MEEPRSPRLCLDPSQDRIVAGMLPQITDAVLATGLLPRALVLAGSFGRGEGALRTDSKERLTNDLDIWLVNDARPGYVLRRRLKAVRTSLPARLGVWHLDFILAAPADLRDARITMARYDLKFGSHVFYGDGSVLDEIPYSQSSRIPADEVQNLLINRLVTLLLGHPYTTYLADPVDKARQISKVLYAVLDSRLVANEGYATRYAQKESHLDIFAAGDPVCAVLSENRRWMRAARLYALGLDEVCAEQLETHWQIARDLLLAEIRAVFRGLDSSLVSDEKLLTAWRSAGKTSGPDSSGIQSALLWLQGKPRKTDVEKTLYRLASSYSSDSRLTEEADSAIANWFAA